MITKKKIKGSKYVSVSCDSCQVLVINNVVCHETGCPESWRDILKACFQCGFDFKREEKYQALCPSCIEDNERNS